jgi:hypothetical protein
MHNAALERPAAIGVETVAYQRALKQVLEERMRKERLWIPVVEIEAKGDKFMRISTNAPLVENGTIRFCLEDPGQVLLMKQLMFLGKMKDDVADAFDIAIRTARGRAFGCAVELKRGATTQAAAVGRGFGGFVSGGAAAARGF